MRRQFLTFVVSIAAAVSVFSVSAYSQADSGARAITVNVAGDSSAYITIAGNAFTEFIETSAGKIKIDFDDNGVSAPVGTGINSGSTYHFHDMLLVTNNGLSAVSLTVAATNANEVAITVCKATTAGTMTNACYAASVTENPLAVGSSVYVGIKLDGTSTTATGSNTGGDVTVTATAV